MSDMRSISMIQGNLWTSCPTSWNRSMFTGISYKTHQCNANTIFICDHRFQGYDTKLSLGIIDYDKNDLFELHVS